MSEQPKTTEAKHTPIPWTMDFCRAYGGPLPEGWNDWFSINGASKQDKEGQTSVVCSCTWRSGAMRDGQDGLSDSYRQQCKDEAQANAEHIVTCVNAHADLLAACEAVQRIANSLPHTLSDVKPLLDAAITAAKGADHA